MGTTRIKVIDLSSDKKEIKTSRKHAEKLAGVASINAQSTGKVRGGKTKEETARQDVGQAVSTTTETAPSQPPEPSQLSKPKKATVRTKSARHKGKKYLDAQTQIDKNKLYPKGEAIELLYKTNFAKFDPTVELHLNVSENNLRGSVKLPHPIETKTKEKMLLVFSEKTDDAKNIIWGSEETIKQIEDGNLKPNKDFDIVFATAKFMPALAKVAKILGPAGMMPNPKNGTIITDPKEAVLQSTEGLFEYRTDPTAPIVHTKLGKLSAKPEQLEENLKALVLAIGPTKIKKATLTSTMGPGIKLDIASIK